jgi:predicted DCC family thiol-disulfide oxidoreductase YuxK
MEHQSARLSGSDLATNRPVIVYDGDCSFCRKQIAKIQRKDVRAQFEYLPKQSETLADRFPVLAQSDFNTGMRLVLPDGQVQVGADAVYHIARRLPGWRWTAWVYRVPIIHALARTVYRWIAANRQRLSQNCDDGTCLVQPAKR